MLAYLVGYMVLLNRDQDVMIDYFYRRFSAPLQRVADAVTALAILAFFLVLLAKSMTLVRLGLNSLHPVFPVPHGIIALPVVVGAAACVLAALRKAGDKIITVIDAGRVPR